MDEENSKSAAEIKAEEKSNIKDEAKIDESKNCQCGKSAEEMKIKLEDCEKLKAEYLAGWQRSRADLINYKKEEDARFAESIDYAKAEFISDILPLLDNLEKAEKEIYPDIKDNNFVSGLLQIKQQFLDFLKKQGVEKIETAGRKFDPRFNEAVELVERKDLESGTIAEEVKAGYLISGRLLRPAKVKVVK